MPLRLVWTRVKSARSFARVAWLATGFAGVSSVGACFSFSDLSGGSDASTDGGGDEAILTDGSITDAVGDGGDESDGALGACKGNEGPTMVRTLTGATNHYCIDSTEVTNRQYSQFVQAIDGGAPSGQPPSCSWNTDPRNGRIIPVNDKPVANVDWCDAWSYCHWANKRLCGKLGEGGENTPTEDGDPDQSEWMNACARDQNDGGAQPYTYGYTFDPLACNGAELDAGATLVVGTLPKCVGTYPGVFDLLGNVDEWVDSCESDTGNTDCCPTQGGGFGDTNLSCGVGYVPSGDCTNRTRAASHSDVGFRCCSN